MVQDFVLISPLFEALVHLLGLDFKVSVSIADSAKSQELAIWDVRDEAGGMEAISFEDGVPVGGLPVDGGVEGPVCVHVDFQIEEMCWSWTEIQTKFYVVTVQVDMEILKRSSHSPK